MELAQFKMARIPVHKEKNKMCIYTANLDSMDLLSCNGEGRTLFFFFFFNKKKATRIENEIQYIAVPPLAVILPDPLS